MHLKVTPARPQFAPLAAPHLHCLGRCGGSGGPLSHTSPVAIRLQGQNRVRCTPRGEGWCPLYCSVTCGARGKGLKARVGGVSVGTELGRGLPAACGARNARPLRCPSAGSGDATLINGREEEKPPQKTSGGHRRRGREKRQGGPDTPPRAGGDLFIPFEEKRGEKMSPERQIKHILLYS